MSLPFSDQRSAVSLDFGALNPDEEKTLTVYIENRGGPARGVLYFDWHQEPGEEYPFLEYAAKFTIYRIGTFDGTYPLELNVTVNASQVKDGRLSNSIVVQSMDQRFTIPILVRVNEPSESELEPSVTASHPWDYLKRAIPQMTAYEYLQFLGSYDTQNLLLTLPDTDNELGEFYRAVRPPLSLELSNLQQLEKILLLDHSNRKMDFLTHTYPMRLTVGLFLKRSAYLLLRTPIKWWWSVRNSS
jgi:hypothetical protein